MSAFVTTHDPLFFYRLAVDPVEHFGLFDHLRQIIWVGSSSFSHRP